MKDVSDPLLEESESGLFVMCRHEFLELLVLISVILDMSKEQFGELDKVFRTVGEMPAEVLGLERVGQVLLRGRYQSFN